jgi:hypothetical protein
MVWYGMVWYGMVWCGVVWYGMVWCGTLWLQLITSVNISKAYNYLLSFLFKLKLLVDRNRLFSVLQKTRECFSHYINFDDQNGTYGAIALACGAKISFMKWYGMVW